VTGSIPVPPTRSTSENSPARIVIAASGVIIRELTAAMPIEVKVSIAPRAWQRARPLCCIQRDEYPAASAHNTHWCYLDTSYHETMSAGTPQRLSKPPGSGRRQIFEGSVASHPGADRDP